ncbi:MAG: FAD-dependent oxidoreductase [Bacteroidetes bacterium]|nr:FAD-dependent oxidoreductase [Bacteroidota bacterium]
MHSDKICVIGAGPAGLATAYELTKKGYKVDVYEADKQVGGMSQSFNLWGQIVDLGPHRFFSTDKRINNLWLEIAGDEYQEVNRITRVFYQGKYFYYPLKVMNVLSNLGLFTSAMCMLSYAKERLSPTKPDGSFENWVVSRFGRRLFEIFFKTYSEKLWGISCKDLDSDFAAQRIKKLSLMEAVINAFKGGKGNTHKSLVDQFYYANGGTGQIYEKMAAYVAQNGGNIHLGKRIHGLSVDGTVVNGIIDENQQKIAYDHVISSMPITQLVQHLPSAPAAVQDAVSQLEFRNTVLVYLEIDGIDLFPDNWLYVHSPQLKTGRITNFRNWVPELYGNKQTTILVLEYWCNFDDAEWSMPDLDFENLAKKELIETGLHQGKEILNSHVFKIPRCYPIYKVGYKDHLEVMTEYLKTFQNFQAVGRYGSFKYNNQDHSLLMGILAAENIENGYAHNLWDINTDYDSYQEETQD